MNYRSLLIPAAVAALAAACGGNGNSDVRTVVPNATNTPLGVVRTYTPEPQATVGQTATPDYCDLNRINESDSYLFSIYPDGWQIAVPYGDGSQKLKQVGNFGNNGREIYGEVLNDLNRQFSDSNSTLRLDSNKKVVIIEYKLRDPSTISIYQNTDGTEPPSIPANELPEGIDFSSITPKLGTPLYCGPEKD